MKKLNVSTQKALKAFAFLALTALLPKGIQAQTIMFDDFTYSGVNELVSPATASNKWSVVNGQSGPPEGAMYSKNNIEFVADPANANNKFMKVSTTVNGTSKAIVNSRIESAYEYFEGTYASRVYLTDEATGTQDGNIQTYFTIVPSDLAQDGTKYSEMDIVEYMASDKWGANTNKQALYTTSYHKYIADPWKPWKVYNVQTKSYAGWHTFMAVCTDKVNIRYYIDGVLIATHSVTDNETQAGLPVYPRSTMQIAYANWIADNALGGSTANRTNTMQVDWTLHYKNTALSYTEVNALVDSYRASGLQRRNMAGQTYSTGVTNQAPSISLTAPANNATYTAPASINITANAADADGSVAKVEFYKDGALIGTDNSSPYAFSWTNVAAGTYSITAKATDNLGLTTTTPAISVKVSPVAVTQSPYKGSPIPIPGIVEAEDYDLGGQGIAFNDVTAANEGGAYRTDAVDLEPLGTGYDVGYIVTDEWLEYTVNVTAGAYNIDANVAAITAGKTFRLELDGVAIANFNVPNTGAWGTFQLSTMNNVTLTAGQKVLRIYATSGDFNVDKITFSKVVVNNQPPTVSLTAPVNNSVYTAPASINITANAADADGTVSKVEFFNGTNSLGSDVTAPYAFSWTNVAAGTYTLTAKVTDNSNAVTTSTAVTVVVNTVTVTGPVIVYQNCNNDPGYSVGLQAGTYTTAQLIALGIRDNDISRLVVQAGYQVTLYSDDNLAGTSYTSTSDAGCLTSVNFNDLTSSIKVALVTVNQAPVVTLTAPANNATFSAPASINVTANASDADGTINIVEFFNGSVSLGTDATSPYAFSWTNVAAGTYTITAKATDNAGATTVSSAVTVVVNTVAPTQTPYAGIFGTIPGIIEAEKYDLGGQGIAFNDITTANEGGAFRTDAVDVEPLGTGYDVGYIVTDEWLEYTVNVTAGTYKIEANVAAIAAGKTFRLELDGAPIANFTVPNTGAWGTFQLSTVNNITLTAGQKVLRIYATSTDFNVDKITFSTATTTPNVAPSITLTGPANNTSLSAPASIAITANASDSDGSVSKVEFFNGTQKLGEDLSAPYTYTWTNVTVGTYTLSAKATDNSGATASSTVATVTVTTVTTSPTRVVGYLPTWGNIATDAGNVDYTVVTHLNVAFANPNASLSGDLDIPAGLLTASQKVHAKGAKILLSIAGGGGSPASYTYLLNAARVDNFVSKLVQATATYQLDGIDVDIEGGIFAGGLTPAMYETFVTKLATGLHAQSKIITCAIATSYANSITSAAAQQYDFINIMSYDATGPWTPNNPGQHSPYQMAVDDVNYWNTVKGVAKNKLVVGVPFYGYGWGTYGQNGAVADYTFADIVNQYPGSENNDQVGSGNNVLYYNGIPTIKSKTTFAKNNAGGIMIWQLLGDASGSKSLLAAIKSALGNTALDQPTNSCASIATYVENGGYTPGSLVQADGKEYQCKPFPYSGWCNGAAWAYTPGTGAYWSDAWILIGSCNSSARSANQASVNENLLSNAPNPFSNFTTVVVETAEAGDVTLALYNKTGQLIKTISQGYLGTGSHEFVVDASGLQADIYLIKCNTPQGVITRKIVKTE
ncbi:MAG: C-terminal target protein [Chitinophagaceae bacterium]|nr:C-terminal target protein [Chitinophagaceae bacterium]